MRRCVSSGLREPPPLPFSHARVALVQATIAAAVADPAGAAQALVLGSARGGSGGHIAPLHGSDFRRLVITRSRTDGLDAVVCGRGSAGRLSTPPSTLGSLVSADVESGARLWRHALPLSPRVREALASSAHLGLRAADVVSSVLVSRSRPLRGHSAELLVVESLPVARGNASSGAAASSYLVALSFVDAETGAVVAEAAYTALAPLDAASATPLLHARTQRGVFALLHTDGSAHIVPGTPSVAAALEAAKVGREYGGCGELLEALRATPCPPTARLASSSTASSSTPRLATSGSGASRSAWPPRPRPTQRRGPLLPPHPAPLSCPSPRRTLQRCGRSSWQRQRPGRPSWPWRQLRAPAGRASSRTKPPRLAWARPQRRRGRSACLSSLRR